MKSTCTDTARYSNSTFQCRRSQCPSEALCWDNQNWEVTVPELVMVNLLENQFTLYIRLHPWGPWKLNNLPKIKPIPACLSPLNRKPNFEKKKTKTATLLGHNYLSTAIKHTECLSENHGSCAHVLLTSRYYTYNGPSLVKKTSFILKKAA